MDTTHTFSKGEEIANAITHGIGALLSIAALVLLIVFSSLHGSAWHVVSFT
ncbi:hemolysin D, partial [Flavobacterium sp. IR1]